MYVDMWATDSSLKLLRDALCSQATKYYPLGIKNRLRAISKRIVYQQSPTYPLNRWAANIHAYMYYTYVCKCISASTQLEDINIHACLVASCNNFSFISHSTNNCNKLAGLKEATNQTVKQTNKSWPSIWIHNVYCCKQVVWRREMSQQMMSATQWMSGVEAGLLEMFNELGMISWLLNLLKIAIEMHRSGLVLGVRDKKKYWAPPIEVS